MATKTSYSFWIGLWKSVQNVAIVMGIPALLLFLDNWTQIIPDQWQAAAMPIIGLLSYLVKNWIKNK